MRVNTHINQVYSQTEVELNYKNSTDSPIEIIVEIPLRKEIIFDHFIAKIKDKIIKSKVIESNKAEEKYNDAIAKGNTGISSTYNLEQKTCCIKIGNIPPKEELNLKCYFIQFLTIKDSFYSLYLIKDLPKIKDVNLDSIKCMIAIENFSQLIFLKDNKEVKKRYSKNDEKSIIEYEYDEFDKILFKTNNMTKPLLISQYNDRLNEINYIFNYYYENNTEKNIEYPCLFIILIDQSGSMDDIIKNVSTTLKELIQSFPKNSYYQLIGFGSEYKIYNLKPEINTKKNIKKSLEIISNLDADLGGTDLSNPLNHILKEAYSDYKDICLSKQIIVLTDGDINIGEDIIELIKLHNNEFRIHLIGIGNDINKELIIESSKAGNGSFHFINDYSNLKTQILSILKDCVKEYINNYNFITNKKYYELQPVNKTTYNKESLNYCFIQNGNEENDISINFKWSNLNKNFSEDFIFKKNDIIKLPNGEELSKLIIGLSLKYNIINSKEEEIKISKKYQVLSENTTLYAEIEGEKPIENKMNTFIQKYSIPKVNYVNSLKNLRPDCCYRIMNECYDRIDDYPEYSSLCYLRKIENKSSPNYDDCCFDMCSPKLDSTFANKKSGKKKNNYAFIGILSVIIIIFICYLINKLK